MLITLVLFKSQKTIFWKNVQETNNEKKQYPDLIGTSKLWRLWCLKLGSHNKLIICNLSANSFGTCIFCCLIFGPSCAISEQETFKIAFLEN